VLGRGWEAASPGSGMSAGTGGPEISIVAPLHNEEDNVGPLFEAIVAQFEPLARPFEVILVDDGSDDGTVQRLAEISGRDPRLRAIHLDGAFGQAAALCAGFDAARGALILTLDGDLQNDPADLPRLLRLLETGGYRAVSGWRSKRQESFATRVLPSLIANRIISRVTGLAARDNGCGLKAYRAEVVKGIYLPHGMHRFAPAVFGVRPGGFAELEVRDRRRRAGRSHYGLSRVFPVVRDLLTIPYILRAPRQSVGRLTGLIGLAGCLIFAGGIALPLRQDTAGMGLELLGLILGAYALLVRAALQRWLLAQETKTFRVRGTRVSAPEQIPEPGLRETGS
jgi:glycosyltransferase involved in cell wall biosynthesis